MSFKLFNDLLSTILQVAIVSGDLQIRLCYKITGEDDFVAYICIWN